MMFVAPLKSVRNLLIRGHATYNESRSLRLMSAQKVKSGTAVQKITFGELREMGIRDVLVFCADYKCSHSTTLSADRWPDHVRHRL